MGERNFEGERKNESDERPVMSPETIGSANCLASGVQVGEYRLQRVIGEGGFGIVYLAHDLSLDRTVAVKEYMPSTLAGRMASHQLHVRSQHRNAFEAGLRSFINEARLLAKFSHPALVHVYRFFEENGTAYMVMRYYEGQTLRSFLETHAGRVDERWLVGLLEPLSEVLEMLHAADCYHRDIAPDNVFLQAQGGPVLLDFGAARRIIGDMTQALTMVLKPGFAPIEQYVDDGAMPQGAWTDIYQLGAMTYLAIVGRAPATSVARMINDPVKALTRQDHPAFSAHFLRGVMQALAIKPQDRPQSMAEFRALLGLGSLVSSPGSEWSSLPPGLASPAPLAPLPKPPATPSEWPAGVIPASAPFCAPDTSEAVPAPRVHASAPSGLSGVSGVSAEWTEPHREPQPLLQPQAASTATHAPREGMASAKPVTAKASESPWGWWLAAGVLPLMVSALLVWWWPRSDDAPPLPAPQAYSEESLQWQSARQAGTAEALQAFLQAYPQGSYHASAQALLDRLPPRSTQPLGAAASAAFDGAVDQRPGAKAGPPSDMPAGAQLSSSPAVQPALSNAGKREPLAQAGHGSAEAPSAPPPKLVPAPLSGKLLLRVTPWGTVSVNQRPMGTTPPLTQLDLPEGQYRIEISNPAAPPVIRTVQVKQGEPVTLSLKFE